MNEPQLFEIFRCKYFCVDIGSPFSTSEPSIEPEGQNSGGAEDNYHRNMSWLHVCLRTCVCVCVSISYLCSFWLPLSRHRLWSCCATSRVSSAPILTTATHAATSTTAALAPVWSAPSSSCMVRLWTASERTVPPPATSGHVLRRAKRWEGICYLLSEVYLFSVLKNNISCTKVLHKGKISN